MQPHKHRRVLLALPVSPALLAPETSQSVAGPQTTRKMGSLHPPKRPVVLWLLGSAFTALA